MSTTVLSMQQKIRPLFDIYNHAQRCANNACTRRGCRGIRRQLKLLGQVVLDEQDDDADGGAGVVTWQRFLQDTIEKQLKRQVVNMYRERILMQVNQANNETTKRARDEDEDDLTPPKKRVNFDTSAILNGKSRE